MARQRRTTTRNGSQLPFKIRLPLNRMKFGRTKTVRNSIKVSESNRMNLSIIRLLIPTTAIRTGNLRAALYQSPIGPQLSRIRRNTPIRILRLRLCRNHKFTEVISTEICNVKIPTRDRRPLQFSPRSFSVPSRILVAQMNSLPLNPHANSRALTLRNRTGPLTGNFNVNSRPPCHQTQHLRRSLSFSTV